jgi:hypothetical protein
VTDIKSLKRTSPPNVYKPDSLYKRLTFQLNMHVDVCDNAILKLQIINK